jgi:hypothetical protein
MIAPTRNPVVVVVERIAATINSSDFSGRPAQVRLTWQNKRCSIGFHFEAPGG